MKPDKKPNVCVNSAAAIAVIVDASTYSSPSSGKTRMKIGVNRAAPPMPLSIAQVATRIDTGNMNQ